MKTVNDLKKGEKVMMAPIGMPRTGVLLDSKKGITRLVKIDETNGYYPDAGSVYVDEILKYFEDGTGNWIDLEISPAHAKKLKTIRAFGF